jgi:hypothetical protein
MRNSRHPPSSNRSYHRRDHFTSHHIANEITDGVGEDPPDPEGRPAVASWGAVVITHLLELEMTFCVSQ